ncbi:MAG: AcvB/VirJ family lysyl-phosphatidylglycerol hydrolase [Acidobacteriota bacterium]
MLVLVLVLGAAGSASAATGEKLDFALRGKALVLTIYPPAGVPKGTILMASGDVGWVGLAVSLSEELSAEGYLVVGINTRQYLAAFTQGTQHLGVQDVPADFRELIDLLTRRQLLHRPLVTSGVSEGAALAVLAASDPKNHALIDGVVTMGLPPVAELAWRWTDMTAWITKSDANEPSFAPGDVIAAVAPLPLVMIQSKKDEYVTEADYQRFLAAARDPKKLVLIDASNHRFTDRRAALQTAYRDALAWIANMKPAAGSRK